MLKIFKKIQTEKEFSKSDLRLIKLFYKSKLQDKEFSIKIDSLFDKKFYFIYSGIYFEHIATITESKTSIKIDYFNSKNVLLVDSILSQIKNKESQIKQIQSLNRQRIFDAGKYRRQIKITDSKEEFKIECLNFQKFEGELGNHIPHVLWNKKVSYLILPLKYSKRNMYFLNKKSHNFYKFFIESWNFLKSKNIKSKLEIQKGVYLKNYDKYSTYILHEKILGIDCKVLLIFKISDTKKI